MRYDRDPECVAEAHRRYQLSTANDRLVEMGAMTEHGWPPHEVSMRLTLVRLMVGSHSHRVPLEDGRPTQ